MKNKNVLKTIGIMILLAFALTWIIPSTSGTAGVVKFGTINPTGYADIFSTLDIIVYYFATPSILILLVGMFYGIINKTGGYKAFVDNIANLFKKNSWIFLLITVLFYGLTTAFTGIYLPMIIFVPLSIAILLELKYKKLSAILATAGSVMVGLTAQISSSVIASVTKSVANTYFEMKFVLLILLLAGVFLYIFMLSEKAKGKKDVEEVDSESMFVPEKRTAVKEQKQTGVLLGIVIGLMFITLILGMTPWNTEIFSDFWKNMEAVKIKDFAIFKSILGTSEVFGKWTITSVFGLIGFWAIIVALFSKLTAKEIVESAVEGAKKVVNLAFIAALLSIVVIFALNSGFAGTIINTIAKSGNIALVTLGTMLSTPFMVEQLYSSQYLLPLLGSLLPDGNMELFGLISQLSYGIAILAAPSSILLIVSLCYTGEKYTSWIKYVWKLLAGVLLLSLVAIFVASGMKAATEVSAIEVNGLTYILVFLSLLLAALMVASMWRIFVKAKNKGWKSLIPVYNVIVELEFLGLPMWYIALFFIPGANIAFVILTSISYAKRFGKDTRFAVGLILLPMIYYPMLAFGDAKYK